MIYMLSKDSPLFPPPEHAEPDGFLAVGGDLSAERLVTAYSNGIFPWYNPGEIIRWYCPSERFVIFPQKIHVSRSMKREMKKPNYTAKFNHEFDKIIHACKIIRQGETWITDEMEAAYNELFRQGYALSCGIYADERPAVKRLIGGIYGVALGRCFFGESMFGLVKNASKFALISLCDYLAKNDYAMLDCQFHTPHLESMGGEFVSWNEYKDLLHKGGVKNGLF